MKKKSFAEALAAGTSGLAGGATAGAAAGPWGALAGGLAGGALGAFGGYLDGEQQGPIDAANMEEQQLKLQGLRRQNRTDQTSENGFNIFKNFLGSAFKSSQPTSFGGALKAYPGLGNQVTP